MIATLLPLSALIGLGLLWVWWRPGPDGDGGRRPVTDIIYHLFLPALVLDVLWRAPLGLDSARISASAVSGVLFGLGLSVLVYRILRVDRPTTGALVLAAGFPNATYLGLPVLERALGETGRGIAIQYDVETMEAPIVVAKGAGLVAQRIRRVALENDIPVVERKELARALYKHVDIGRPIPPEQYAAMAEVLRYVYQLKGRTVPHPERAA